MGRTALGMKLGGNGFERHSGFKALKRLVGPLEIKERNAPIGPAFHKSGVQRTGGLVTLEGLLVAAGFVQDKTPLKMRESFLWIQK